MRLADIARPARVIVAVSCLAAAAAVLLSDPYAPAFAQAASRRVEVRRSTAAVPPEIAGTFEEPVAFQQARSGQYFVLDRRAQAVYAIDREWMAGWRVVGVGREPGRVFEPAAMTVLFDGRLAVVDYPDGPRVQIFTSSGTLLSGFKVPTADPVRLALNGAMIRGIGWIHPQGDNLVVGQPENGALFSEYHIGSRPVRSFGDLRETGHEADRDLHLALNAGVPLVDPTGGYYYVFITGRPAFRKYDAAGKMLFERHIEGPELDAALGAQANRWPRREVGGQRELPVTPPLVRTAAVDPAGRLWVALTQPYTYVYDGQGERVRVVQLRGAGVMVPSSLFFPGDGRLLVTPGCYQFGA